MLNPTQHDHRGAMESLLEHPALLAPPLPEFTDDGLHLVVGKRFRRAPPDQVLPRQIIDNHRPTPSADDVTSASSPDRWPACQLLRVALDEHGNKRPFPRAVTDVGAGNGPSGDAQRQLLGELVSPTVRRRGVAC